MELNKKCVCHFAKWKLDTKLKVAHTHAQTERNQAHSMAILAEALAR